VGCVLVYHVDENYPALTSKTKKSDNLSLNEGIDVTQNRPLSILMCNSLPAELRQADINFQQFKWLLKTFLFGF